MEKFVGILVVMVCLCRQITVSTSDAAIKDSYFNEDVSNTFTMPPSVPSTSSQDISTISDSVFPTSHLTPTTNENVMPTPTKSEVILPSELPASMTPDNSSLSLPPILSPASTASVEALPSNSPSTSPHTDSIPPAIVTTTTGTSSSSASSSFVGPTSSPPHLPVSCSCVQSLGLSLGLSIPATVILTFIGTALLFMYCPKAKKNGPYVRMAPTVYFDEEEQD